VAQSGVQDMLKDRLVYLNGEHVRWGEAHVPLMSHSVARGSAIFEVIGFHDTAAGPAVFRLDEHVSRFRKSASLLDMESPIALEDLSEVILCTVRLNGLREGLIKVIGYYPEIAFGILPPRKKFHLAVFVFAHEDVPPEGSPSQGGGVSACVSQWRRLDPRTVPIEAKAAANYLNGIMARQEARKRGFDYALMLDTRGFLAEGGTESVFLFCDGRLMTPSLGTILDGISRKSLLTVAADSGVETVAGDLSPDLLDKAAEIFFSSTPCKVTPVKRMNDRVLDEAPGPVATKLAERLEMITSGRDARYRGWLFPVG